MITEKTHKCRKNGRHAAMLEMPERAFEDCQHKLKNATVKSYRTIMLTSPIGGAPLRQYDPKLMRARSRFEGESTPTNEWNMRLRRTLRSNKHQGQVHPNVTEVYVPIIHMMLGKDGPRQR